uniref:RNA helicase n=1 Tax=Toxocara canis TaxID=6265 RepID=A0A183U947_TOXCA
LRLQFSCELGCAEICELSGVVLQGGGGFSSRGTAGRGRGMGRGGGGRGGAPRGAKRSADGAGGPASKREFGGGDM